MANVTKVTEMRSVNKKPESIFVFKATQLVWLIFGILEGLLGLRFVLKLIAANPNSPIAALIYRFTDLFLSPFNGLTVTPAAGGMVLELSTLFAMVIYALIAWALDRLIWVLFYRPRGPVEQVTETTSSELHSDQHTEQPPKGS